VLLEHLPLERQSVHPGTGLVLCNPPYGKRLQADTPLEPYFARLGRDLQRAYPGWRKALLLPDPLLARATGLPLREVAILDNGGLRVGLYATLPPSRVAD
jgi:23S rRNA G2445 N2-methylase RlmL